MKTSHPASKPHPPQNRPVVRWARPGDVIGMLAIERSWRLSKEDCWACPVGLLDWLPSDQHYAKSVVCLSPDALIVGHAHFVVGSSFLHLANIAVHPRHCRKGYGRLMLRALCKLPGKLRRPVLRTVVRESDVNAQMFFKKCGLRYEQTFRGWWDCPLEDGYELLSPLVAD